MAANILRKVLLAAVGLLLAVPAAASAAPVTLGALAPSNPPADCTNGPGDIIQSGLAGSDTTYVVPPGYTTIASWSTNAAAGAGQTLEFKVFRPVSGSPGNYTVVAHDGPQPLTPSSLNSFPVHISVQGGDLIALNDENAFTTHDACDFATGNSADSEEFRLGDAGDGSTVDYNPPAPQGGNRLNITATAFAPAAVSALLPASGSVDGGTTVVIAGHDLTGASAVDFGGTPAASFKVDSDNAISAVVPPHTAGTADVTVTTPAGQTSPTAADQFTYTPAAPQPQPVVPKPQPASCIVPNLRGKTLPRARKLLKAAHCRLGIVAKPKHRHGQLIIKSQSPAAGTVLADGGSVSVKLGPKPHHKKRH